MAGHSKWANIQHRKKAQDARRGKLFTKLIREITIAARQGGVDASTNPRLRLAMDKALSANMTRDTIDRAIKRGAGDAEDIIYEEIRYEGYGPGGAAVMVECMTDNRNRTVSDVRYTFNKYGGNLGTDGSVAFLFNKAGVLSYEDAREEIILEHALEAGANDVVTYEDGSIDVLADPESFIQVKSAMVEAGLIPVQAEVTLRPDTLSPLDEETAEKMMRLLEALEDLDDVQAVYTNADFPTPTSVQAG